MGLGVLEPYHHPHVPGTVILDEEAAHSEETTAGLKHGTGSNAHIVLVPQPSEDPNDPLNWTWFEKHWILFILCMGTIIITDAPGPLLNAGVVQMSMELNRSVTDITKLSGYLLLTTGATGPFVSALARKYGKRPLYVACSIFGLIGTIIGECATGYAMLIPSRVIQGIGISAYESIITASISDLFFVHERGPRVATVIFMLGAISNGISIIAGVITANLGWHYNFHILLPFTAIQTVLVILFAPETAYRRAAIYNLDTQGSGQDLSKLASLENRARHRTSPTKPASEEDEKVSTLHQIRTTESAPPRKRHSFVKRLALYNGTFTDSPLLKMLLACPTILTNLAASFNIFVSGLVIAWYVAAALISSLIFTAPPYLYTAAGVGYTSVGPLLGGLLGAVFMSLASDPTIKYLTRRNAGIYEPEFRLPLTVVGVVFTVAGLSGFGHAVEGTASVYLLCFLWGVMLFGIVVVATTTANYVLDAFPAYAVEVFMMNMVFKNFFYYGLTNFIVDWYMTAGASVIFDTFAGISAGMCLLAVPMYVFGKKYRAFWERYDVIKMLKLETDKATA